MPSRKASSVAAPPSRDGAVSADSNSVANSSVTRWSIPGPGGGDAGTPPARPDNAGARRRLTWRPPDSPIVMMAGTRQRDGRNGGRVRGALHLHAGCDRGPRDHFPGPRDPAYAPDVGLQLHPRHRAHRCDGGARARGHDAGEGDRLRRGAAGRGQRGRWVRGDRTHARDVQVQPQAGEKGVMPADFAVLIAATSYFVAATLFLLGLQRMASPVTARSGIQWGGVGMVVATVATFLLPGLHNLALIVVALVIGTVGAWVWGKKVAITDMPQMVALFNGMGGGSAAAIGAVELLKLAGGARDAQASTLHVTLAVVGALIGAVSLTGSVIAWAKLDGRMDKRYTFPGQQIFNALVFVAAVVLGGVA